MSAAPLGVQGWVDALIQRQLPIFSQTATWVLAKTHGDMTSSHEVTQQILRDAAMTSRLLKVANSWHFNPGGQPIGTVSRAIVVLGFDTIRDICLSIKLMESFVGGAATQHVLPEMVASLQAAAQARELARLAKRGAPEEIYIAALLYRLGALAVLAFGHEIDPVAHAAFVAARSRQDGGEAAEYEALGFDVRLLGDRLNREWRLSEALGEAFHGAPTSPVMTTVRLGHALAAAMAEGSHAAALDDALGQIERQLKLPRQTVRDRALQTRTQASREMEAMGIHVAAVEPLVPAAAVPWPQPDAALLMQVVQELGQLLAEPRPNPNAVLALCMEGMVRAVGLDRAVFALLTSDRRRLRAKHAVGHADDEALRRFDFDAQPLGDAVLARILREGRPRWFGAGGEDLAEGRVSAFLGYSGGKGMVMPLCVGPQPIGLLLADRQPSGRPLDAALFAQFQMLAQQARLGFALLKSG